MMAYCLSAVLSSSRNLRNTLFPPRYTALGLVPGRLAGRASSTILAVILIFSRERELLTDLLSYMECCDFSQEDFFSWKMRLCEDCLELK